MPYKEATFQEFRELFLVKSVFGQECLKEMLDYYIRLEVAELEGDLFKASRKGDADKLARIYKKLIMARAALSKWENSVGSV